MATTRLLRYLPERRIPEMNARHRIVIALLACMPLAACSNTSTPPATPPSTSSPATQPTSTLGRVVEKEIREARVKLANENINLGSIHVRSGHRGVSVFSEDENKN